MIPILAPAYYDFQSADPWEPPTGVFGWLSECASCQTVEERNGEFTLELKYPVTGHLYNDLQPRCIILAKPDDRASGNYYPFRIYVISDEVGGLVTVKARHAAYDLTGVPVHPFTANSVYDAIAALNDTGSPMFPHGFNFFAVAGGSDFPSGTLEVKVPTSVRAVMGGSENSILAVYGGEWEYTAKNIILNAQRGADNNETIRYGNNLKQIRQERNIEEMYTGIAPYAVFDDSVRTLSEGYIEADGTFDFRRIKCVDLTDKFETMPTEAQLRAAAKTYIRDNDIGKPDVSITVDYQPTGNGGYSWNIGLCDYVTVLFERLNIAQKAKVVKLTYDVLAERIISADIGTVKKTFADKFVEIKNGAWTERHAEWVSVTDLPETKFSSAPERVQGTYFGRSGYRIYNAGGDYYAYQSTQYSSDHAGWNAFDGSNSVTYRAASADTAPWVALELPSAMRNMKINIRNASGSTVNGVIAGAVYGANVENETPVLLKSFSGLSGGTASAINTVNVENETAYKYVVLAVTDWQNRTSSGSHYMQIAEMTVDGEYMA